MAEAKVVKTIAAPADDVWAQLSDFAGIKPGGPIEAVEYEGEGVGMVRTLTMGGGLVIERLETHDAQARSHRIDHHLCQCIVYGRARGCFVG